jgi:hypothetical protein
MRRCLLQSSAEVHEVILAEVTGSVSGVTPAMTGFGQVPEVTFAAVVGGDPTIVMEVEVELLTCPSMECRLGGTLVEHPQYYLPKVLS